MSTFRHTDGWTLTIEDTGRRKGQHARVEYSLIDPDRQVVFTGDDYGASPLYASDGPESACALLSFLTLQPGDTDSEYFSSYTPAQLEFASHRAEYLQPYDDNELSDDWTQVD